VGVLDKAFIDQKTGTDEYAKLLQAGYPNGSLPQAYQLIVLAVPVSANGKAAVIIYQFAI